jgi:hypothetical protein
VQQVEDEFVDAETMQQCVKEYDSRMGRQVSTKFCGCCGVKHFSIQYRSVALRDLGILEISSLDRAEYDSQSALAQSVWTLVQHDGRFFHLHSKARLTPAEAKGDVRYMVCQECLTSIGNEKVPELALKNNHDYGQIDQFPVADLRTLEKAVISPARTHGRVLNLYHSVTGLQRSPILRGHIIAFPHKALEVLATVLPNMAAADGFRVVYVSPEGNIENLGQDPKYLKEVSVDPSRIIPCLLFMQAVNPRMRQYKISTTPEGMCEAIQTKIMNCVEHETSPEARSAAARAFGDDIAKVRTGADPASTPFEHTVVYSSQVRSQQNVCDDHLAQFEAVLGSVPQPTVVTGMTIDENLGTTQTSGQKEPFKIPRAEDPYNEFSNNGALYLDNFPYLLLRGQFGNLKGSVSRKQVLHLLRQHDGRFARDPTFIATLYDQDVRHEILRTVHSKARGESTQLQARGQPDGNFKEIVSFMTAPDSLKRCQEARANPDTPETREFIQKMYKLVKFNGVKVPYSPKDRFVTQSKLSSLMLRYGEPILDVDLQRLPPLTFPPSQVTLRGL